MRHRSLVALVIALGLAARAVAAVALGNSFHFPDESVYVDAARGLLTGHGFGEDYARVPAYPVFLAALAAALPGSPDVLFLRAGQAAVTALGSVFVYLLSLRAFGRTAALAAAFFYALDPLLVVIGGLLYPEAIAAVLMVMMVLATLLAARTNRLAAATVVGLLVGILAQLRPVSLVLLPVLSVWMWCAIPASRSRRIGHVGALAFACLLSLSPWMYRTYRVHGQLMPIATGGTQSAPVAASEVRQDGLTQALARKAWAEPLAFGARMARQFAYFWELYPTRLATDNPERRIEMRARWPGLNAKPVADRGLRDTLSAISFGCELVLALVGLVLAWRTRRREAVLLVSIVLAYALGYALFVAKLRYRVPVLPLVFVFAGVGVDALGRGYALVRTRANAVTEAKVEVPGD